MDLLLLMFCCILPAFVGAILGFFLSDGNENVAMTFASVPFVIVLIIYFCGAN